MRQKRLRLSKATRKALAELGRIGGLKGGHKGGTASMAALTPEERKAKARKAIQTRWKRVRAAKKAKAAKQAGPAVTATPESASGPLRGPNSPATKTSSDRWRELYPDS